jgi:heme oxygenase
VRQSQQLREWRRSAQRVTRAWNAWLAAESGDRGARYRAFVAALADEERAAAEVARMVDLAGAGQSVSAIDRRNGRMGAL